MVGNIGQTNPIGFGHGKIRSIRFSKGKVPPTSRPGKLRPDRTAVLIYSAQSVDGDAVRDLSGHFNDGRVERF